MKTTRIAIPAEDDSGYPALRSGHFGRAPYFAIIDVDPLGLSLKKSVKNDAHEKGHEAIVKLLVDEQVEAVMTIGIGAPMAIALGDAGISVYRETSCETVLEAARALAFSLISGDITDPAGGQPQA